MRRSRIPGWLADNCRFAQGQQLMLPFHEPSEYTTDPKEVVPEIHDFSTDTDDEWATGFYHVTTNLPAVLHSGELRSRRQLQDPIGLGGGGRNEDPFMVSVTHNRDKAESIRDMMQFAASVAHGQARPSLVLSEFMKRHGQYDIWPGGSLEKRLRNWGVPRKMLGDDPKGDVDAWLDAHLTDPEEVYRFMQDVDEALLRDAGEGEMPGGYTGFTMPFEIFSRINPGNIGIVEVMARKDAKPKHVPGELELRFRPEDIMLLQDRPTVLQSWVFGNCKFASTRLASYDEMAMVSPEGKMLDTGGLSHPDWALKNWREMGIRFEPVKTIDYKPTSDLKEAVLDAEDRDPLDAFMSEGWIRVRPSFGVQTGWLDENNLSLVKQILRDMSKHTRGRSLYVDTGEGTLSVPISMTGRPDFSILDARAGKAYAWVMSQCKFAQVREQQYLPFYDPKEYKPIPEDDVNWPDPSVDPIGALEEMLDEHPEEVRKFLDANGELYGAEDVGFEDAGTPQKADPVIVVIVGGKPYVVEEAQTGYGSVTEANEWLNDIMDHQLGYYVGYQDFNAEFWDGADGLVLYHATDPGNVESIMSEGLNPSSRTRAISNRGMGAAVFTGPSPEAISSYGEAVFAIDVGAMKADGYMPEVSQEGPLEDAAMRDALAYKVGIEDYRAAEEYGSEGLSEDTVAFFGQIPPKYLRLES